MRPITTIVIHCSDTPDERDHNAADIDQWHKEFGWDGIGYHHVIRRDGTIEAGRPYEVVGAHVQGHNANSIGICLIGRNKYTEPQMISLEGLVNALKARWRGAEVLGHCDLDNRKTCPNFNVLEWWDDCRHRRID